MLIFLAYLGGVIGDLWGASALGLAVASLLQHTKPVLLLWEAAETPGL